MISEHLCHEQPLCLGAHSSRAGWWGLGNPEVKILSSACSLLHVNYYSSRLGDKRVGWTPKAFGIWGKEESIGCHSLHVPPTLAEPAGWKQSLCPCLSAHVDNFCHVKASSSTKLLCTFLHMRSHCSGCSVCVLSFQLPDLHSWILYVWNVKFLLETLS